MVYLSTNGETGTTPDDPPEAGHEADHDEQDKRGESLFGRVPSLDGTHPTTPLCPSRWSPRASARPGSTPDYVIPSQFEERVAPAVAAAVAAQVRADGVARR